MMYIKSLIEQVCCSEDETFSEPRHVVCVDKPKQHMNEQQQNMMNRANVKDRLSRKKYVSPFPTAEEPEKMYEFNTRNGKKYLLIDLDRTLIYYDEKGFIMRPHLNRFLRAMHQYYNIYIFTAASQEYLNIMMQYMQESKVSIECICGFLTRKNCVQIQTNDGKNVFVKDINVIQDCDPSQIVVVDDSPISYCLNPDNAVPILPFEGQPVDNQLFFLNQTLTEIKDYNDVRDYIHDRYTFTSLTPPTTPKKTNQSILTNSTHQ